MVIPAVARFTELALGAQTAYAEIAEQTRAFELANALAGISGSFHKLTRRGQDYWYFAFRDLGQKVRMAYVGPDNERARALVSRFEDSRDLQRLAPAAKSAIALGCAPVAPKHFRIIKRLADHGFFRAGGILIGTHAFLTLGNLLGVRWTGGAATLDVDFAHAGRNVSLALPADLSIDVHGALESLEMGLLPLTQFDGSVGAQYRNPRDPELRLDFLTSMTRSGEPLVLPDLNIALQPMKFMELALERPTLACVLGTAGACTVSVPAPELFAIHKLIVHGERPVSDRTKGVKDLLQAASLIDYFWRTRQAATFNSVWKSAMARRGWRSRLRAARAAVVAIAPDLDALALWRE